MHQKLQSADTSRPAWHEPVSRPIDVHRWSDYPELNHCLNDLLLQIESTEGRTRRRKEESEKRFRDAVRSLVLDLYVAWTADPVSTVGVALGKDKFRPNSRYQALFLTYDTFLPAFYGLEKTGYLQIVQRGRNYGHARVTRVRATEKLIQLLTGPGKLIDAKVTYRLGNDAPEPVILRDENKRRIDYADTNYTTTIRDELRQINDLLADHHIDLRITDAEMAVLNRRMNADFRDDKRARSSVDFAAKRLRRIFNVDWEHGGRFYGGWWQNIPKEYRRYITIDDKPTVEVDFSGMHVLMMYASLDAELDDGDAYDVGLPGVPREVIKIEFNKLVNAENRMRQNSELAQYGITSEQLHDRIRARHRPIARFFKSGHGSELQNKDADLAARVMMRFLEMNRVCLPVHDSFLVNEKLEDVLIHVMGTEFKSMFGVDPGLKSKPGIEPTPLPGLVDNPIGELIFPTGDYSGHDTRVNNWWVAKDNLEGR